MAKLRELLTKINNEIIKIEYYPKSPSELIANKTKQNRILSKFVKAEELLKWVTKKNRPLYEKKIARLKVKLDRQVADAIWNYSVKLQNEYDAKLLKGESVSLYELDRLAELFQNAFDAYKPLLPNTSSSEKEAIFENLAKIKEQLADYLVDEFKQKQQAVNIQTNHKRKLGNDWHFDRAFQVYQEAIEFYRLCPLYNSNGVDKILKISLSCLNIVYEQHQINLINKNEYLEKLTNFINKFGLKELSWKGEDQEEFNWYVAELKNAEPQKTASLNQALFFNTKKPPLEEQYQNHSASLDR